MEQTESAVLKQIETSFYSILFLIEGIISKNKLHFHCINKSVFLLCLPGSGSIEIPVLCVLIAGDATMLEVITLVYFFILI